MTVPAGAHGLGVGGGASRHTPLVCGRARSTCSFTLWRIYLESAKHPFLPQRQQFTNQIAELPTVTQQGTDYVSAQPAPPHI